MKYFQYMEKTMQCTIKSKHKFIIFYTLINTIISLNVYAHGENAMRPVYSLNKALMSKLNPKIYSTKKNKKEGMFDVPVNNTIATNKKGNAITLIHFKEDKIKYDTLKSDFLDYVSGGDDGYMSIFSEDTIGYSIGRGFLLFNIKNNKFSYNSIAGGFDYKISQIEVVDPEKKIFIFKIRDVSRRNPTFLRLMDLSEEPGKILAEKEVGPCGIVIINKIIFVYHANEIYAMNINFEKVAHPLVAIFDKEKHKDYGKTLELIIHPTLPFAILNEEKRGESYRDTKTAVWCVSWRENDMNSDKPKMIKLLSESTYHFTFTYDGKWLWFVDASISPRNFILMPVNPDLPYFIDKPIYLGEYPKYLSGNAMTRNPSGLVISENEGYEGKCWLKKWDFTEAEKLLEKNRINEH